MTRQTIRDMLRLFIEENDVSMTIFATFENYVVLENIVNTKMMTYLSWMYLTYKKNDNKCIIVFLNVYNFIYECILLLNLIIIQKIIKKPHFIRKIIMIVFYIFNNCLNKV